MLLLALAASPPPAARGEAARATLLENRAYGGTLLAGIRAARRSVVCAFYLFKVTPAPRNLPRGIAAALIDAARRGVAVTVILDGGKRVGEENRATALLLTREGVKVLFTPRRVTTHVKAAVIDDRFVLIGSHNLTQAALAHNNELSVLLDSPRLAAKTKRYLERLPTRPF